MRIRDAVETDFPAILDLNAESVHYLSPLDMARLRRLHVQSAHHRVAEAPQGIVGFLLAFREGADYDSPNYQWFRRVYERFMYIDRVVVSAHARGQGTGQRLYLDLFARAEAAACPHVTCEFYLDPPNPVSEAFHRRFGFAEVGRQWIAGGTKLVSLQHLKLPRRAGAPIA